MENILVWTSVVVGGAAVALYFILSKETESKYQLPPSGPTLPVVGSLLYLGKDPFKPLAILQKKLGDVFTVYFGSKPTIILNTYDSIKTAFIKQGNEFIGRPQDTIITEKMTKGMGIVFAEGSLWQEQRKFVHGVFREFGVGKSVMEEKIQQELQPLVEHIKNMSGKSVNVMKPLQVAVSNVIGSMIFGYRREYSDPKLMELFQTLDETFKAINQGGVFMVFPWLNRIPGDPFRFQSMLDKVLHMFAYYQQLIREHKENFDHKNINNLIDKFLNEMERQQALGNKNSSFNEEQLVMLVNDLFSAGSETTATTLNWAIVYLLHHPDVQTKVQNEITSVLGKEWLPAMSDKPQLPYTEATLLEIQRLATISPFTIPHKTVEDVHFRNYILPCGITVLGNLYAVHHDPDTWPDPYKFDPTRFLDSEGKVANFEKLIQFSMGKRVCLGESLARMELFLFFTTLLQHFTFKLPQGQTLPDLEGTYGVTRTANPFTVEVEIRS